MVRDAERASCGSRVGLQDLLALLLSPSTQRLAGQAMGAGPLPDALLRMATTVVEGLRCNGLLVQQAVGEVALNVATTPLVAGLATVRVNVCVCRAGVGVGMCICACVWM